MDAKVNARAEAKVIKEDEIVLVPGEVTAILELIVTDKEGKVTERRVMKSESFVRQFMELLWTFICPNYNYNPLSTRDTSNTVRSAYRTSGSGSPFACNTAVGITTDGIVVGTGAVAPTINDYALGALIAHGVGAGQLQYSAMTFGAPASDATTSQFTLTRNFANGSGAAITVNEVGLYVKSYDGATRYFVTIRDIVAGGISVPNGQTLTVNYRIQGVV